MIKIIVGGIGSGKTLTVVKEIVKNDRKCFCNFDIKHKKAVRLRVDHIIKEEYINEKKTKTKKSINWDFWNELIDKKENFDIYIDEAHNVLNSRRSLSTWNTLITTWITQIRKVLGDNENFNLYLVTQRIDSLDVVIRKLAYEVIYCQKLPLKSKSDTKVRESNRLRTKNLQNMYIIQYHFQGTFATDNYITFMEIGSKSYNFRSYFHANPYFHYYDSYSIVMFGNEVYV